MAESKVELQQRKIRNGLRKQQERVKQDQEDAWDILQGKVPRHQFNREINNWRKKMLKDTSPGQAYTTTYSMASEFDEQIMTRIWPDDLDE